MISPPGLPVPKKVTARKQEPSASPGSGNFRDAVLNMHRAQALGPTQALPCKWVTVPSVVRGGDDKVWVGRSGAGGAAILPAGRGHRDTAVVIPTAGEESGLLPLPRPRFVEVLLSSKEMVPLFNFLPSPLPSASERRRV